MHYTPDHDAQDAKRQELIETVAETLGMADRDLAIRLVDAFCQLSPPQDPPMLTHLITTQSGGYRGGETRKLGNIRLNWLKLLRELPEMSLTIVGVFKSPPSLIALAALSLWNKLYTHSAIPLSPEHATALVAMWHRRDENNRIHRNKAFAEVNDLFRVYSWLPLDGDAFAKLLTELAGFKCIELKGDDRIWLREWVQSSYN